jgi:hypothetical protein
MRKCLLCILPLMLLGLLGATTPASKARRSKIAISTHLDKTAMWVGDTVQYTVRAVHDKDIDFVMDNLKAENLNLAPFVLRDVTSRQSSFGANKNLLEVTLLLTAYEVGKPELRIPSFNLYFFVREPGFEKQAEAQAETIAVPAARIGLRSTLAGENLKLRDLKETTVIGPQNWIIPLALGLAGIMFLGVQTGRRAWSAVRVVRPKKKRLSLRARRRMAQNFLKNIKLVGKETPDEQVRFYSEVSQFLRNYLSESLDAEAQSLTPEEIENLLKGSGKNGASAEPVRAILEKCDQVLYGKDGARLGQNWRGDVEKELESLIRRYG